MKASLFDVSIKAAYTLFYKSYKKVEIVIKIFYVKKAVNSVILKRYCML
mgnify:FL=1